MRTVPSKRKAIFYFIVIALIFDSDPTITTTSLCMRRMTPPARLLVNHRSTPMPDHGPHWPELYLSKDLVTELRKRMAEKGWNVPTRLDDDPLARHLARSLMSTMVTERLVRLRASLDELSDTAPVPPADERAQWAVLWSAPAEIELLRDAMAR